MSEEFVQDTTVIGEAGRAEDAASNDTAASTSSSQEAQTEDSLTFSNEVIEKIVACACLTVPGVAGMRQGFFNRVKETFTGASSSGGVEIEVADDGSVIINIAIVMKYGAYAPAVFEGIRDAVTKEVKAMTALDVSCVNLRVEDVLAPGESASASEKTN